MNLKDVTPNCASLSLKEADKLFFSEESEKRIAKAKALCADCPMTQACLELGMESEFGIYGGLTAAERKEMANVPN